MNNNNTTAMTMITNIKPKPKPPTFFHFPMIEGSSTFTKDITILPECPGYDDIKALYKVPSSETIFERSLGMCPLPPGIFGSDSMMYFLEDAMYMKLEQNCLLTDVLYEVSNSLEKKTNDAKNSRERKKYEELSEALDDMCNSFVLKGFPLGSSSIYVKKKEMASLIMEVIQTDVKRYEKRRGEEDDEDEEKRKDKSETLPPPPSDIIKEPNFRLPGVIKKNDEGSQDSNKKYKVDKDHEFPDGK